MFALSIVIVVVLFSVTIFVHELGHFLVARWCGMVVDTFSLGFGPALWKRERNGVAARAALFYVWNQLEQGTACPVTMTL